MVASITSRFPLPRFAFDLASSHLPAPSAFVGHPASTRSCRTSTSRKQAGMAMAYVGVQGTLKEPLHTLGLDTDASEQDIKKAYRRLALQYHPDVCKGESCTTQFMQISDAYERIMEFVQGTGGSLQEFPANPYYEGMMGINDDSWEDWEEWMGWEGAGTRDYSNHINHSL